jgi:predicted Zn-dependent protease
VASNIRKSTTALGDPAVEKYIQELGRRLDTTREWEFAVIRDDVGGSTHEPLSIPGGHIFVPVSLIMAAQNEAELAGMIAHAMAHATERHGVRGGDGRPLIFMGAWMGDRTVVPAAFAKGQRDNELDADRAAASILAAAGYSPAALAAYIGRTEQAARSWFPPPQERVAAIESAANVQVAHAQPTGEFDAMQARLRELTSPPKRPAPSLRRKNER